ncbi:hypothetical protein EYZ11_010882 [Aspergillus tanneri]|uniref:Uncharacterized protein n=1 Tax=Aspergillus tanneri TaxID=1220188 RepID=A0A4S3J9N6_9EURO|nr:hypothetical protein EYZ11_010882 [Aspergillus tanneri]
MRQKKPRSIRRVVDIGARITAIHASRVAYPKIGNFTHNAMPVDLMTEFRSSIQP